MSYEDLQVAFNEAENNTDKVDAYRQWRANFLLLNRQCVKEKQIEFCTRFGMTQSKYAKFEKPKTWGDHIDTISNTLNAPRNMLKNSTSFENFIQNEGAKTFVRLIEVTIDKILNDSLCEPSLPVEFIRSKLLEQQRNHQNEAYSNYVHQFLNDPCVNDLDQEVKRWLESLLHFKNGSISNPNHFKMQELEIGNEKKALRNLYSKNVANLLIDRNISIVKLASMAGIPRSSIKDDGKGNLISLRINDIEAVAIALGVEPWQLLMERGPEIVRESVGAFSNLPDFPRFAMQRLYTAITETDADGNQTAGAETVTGLLPALIAVLEFAQREAKKSPQLVLAARAIQEAFSPKK
jgi:transcriptional regulator with XRE-family HTH domain